jgi:hypothetical protein
MANHNYLMEKGLKSPERIVTQAEKPYIIPFTGYRSRGHEDRDWVGPIVLNPAERIGFGRQRQRT